MQYVQSLYSNVMSLNPTLDVKNASTDNSAQVVIYPFTGSKQQSWVPIDNGDLTYSFVNLNAHKCLDIDHQNINSGAGLVIYDCHLVSSVYDSQHWIWQPNNGLLISAASMKPLSKGNIIPLCVQHLSAKNKLSVALQPCTIPANTNQITSIVSYDQAGLLPVLPRLDGM